MKPQLFQACDKQYFDIVKVLESQKIAEVNRLYYIQTKQSLITQITSNVKDLGIQQMFRQILIPKYDFVSQLIQQVLQ